MKELVSIIVPVHNSSKYLKKCLDSIKKQTYKNIEIIAVENGSKDKSLEILKSYKNIVKIEVLKEANLGKARNKGISVAKGTFISFIDSDDVIEPDFIEKLLENINAAKSDMSLCNVKEIHKETKTEKTREDYPNKKINREEIMNNLVSFDYGPCNKLFKKEIIIKNKLLFPENLKYEDVPFILGYISNCQTISKVNEELYKYNIHKESEQTTIDERIFDIIEITNLLKRHVNIYQLESLFTKLLTTYSLKTRHIKDTELRNKFIDEAYKILDENFNNWKECDYLQTRPFMKRMIQKNKFLIKLYTDIYASLH